MSLQDKEVSEMPKTESGIRISIAFSANTVLTVFESLLTSKGTSTLRSYSQFLLESFDQPKRAQGLGMDRFPFNQF